jgi:uncharacterized SAM-binding protein YcdF (DUF218 family)
MNDSAAVAASGKRALYDDRGRSHHESPQLWLMTYCGAVICSMRFRVCSSLCNSGPRPMIILQRFFKKGMTRWRSQPIVIRRRLLVGGLLLLGVNCLYLILTYEPLLIWFAYRFRAEDPLAQSDAIVMLLGGPDDRPARAAEIYRKGLAPVILMGQTERNSYETQYHRQALIQSEVPADAIAILPGDVVRSTHDEALRVRDYVRTHSVRRIIVVTSSYHSARTCWTFLKVLRSLGVEVHMAVSQDPRFTETDWYKWDEGIKVYLSETLKILYYRLVY